MSERETVVGIPWAADRCPWVGKLRTVLPLTAVIRDSAVQLRLGCIAHAGDGTHARGNPHPTQSSSAKLLRTSLSPQRFTSNASHGSAAFSASHTTVSLTALVALSSTVIFADCTNELSFKAVLGEEPGAAVAAVAAACSACCATCCPRTAMRKLRIVRIVRRMYVGWEIAHGAVTRRPPISLHTIVPRTGGFTYDVGVWGLSIVQGPFSVAPCQTPTLRFATLSSLYRMRELMESSCAAGFDRHWRS
jgi:hypothetical protein